MLEEEFNKMDKGFVLGIALRFLLKTLLHFFVKPEDSQNICFRDLPTIST